MNCNYDGQFQLLFLFFIEKVWYDKKTHRWFPQLPPNINPIINYPIMSKYVAFNIDHN